MGVKVFSLSRDSKSIRREGKSWGGIDYSLNFGHANNLSSKNKAQTKDAQKVIMF